MDDLEHTTYADFDTVRNTLISLLVIANRNMSEYLMRKDPIKEKVVRETLVNLVLNLHKKAYVLKDPDAINYLSYFMCNPQDFHMLDLQATLLICQTICERIGLTKIEQTQIPKHKAFMEDGDF